MSAIYVLKDPVYNEYASKTNNFTLEWFKWFHDAKIAPKEHEITKDDIVIINLYEGNPYGQYNIPRGCKKIFIVHKLSQDNIKYLEDAKYVIYINKYQKQIASIFGINKPSYVCPRHPMHDYSVEFNTDSYVYIGGWFFEDRMDGLLERILKLNSEVPEHLEFVYFGVWGDLNSRKEKINEFATLVKQEKELKHRINAFLDNQLSYNTMLFRTRTAEYGYLWRNEPTIEERLDLISSKDESVLDFPVYESAMLSHFQSGNAKVIAEDRLCFIPAHEEMKKFTYKDFSDSLKNAINSI